MSDSKILEKIRKLVTFAKNGSATEAEVEAYMRAAKKLMSQHNVEEHQVLADPNNKTARQAAYETIREDWSGYEQTGKIQLFDRTLLNAVCDICEVRVIFRTTVESLRKPGEWSKARFESVHFIGLPADVAVAKEFFKELRASVRTLARVRFGPKWARPHFDYAYGFAARLAARAFSFRQSMAPTGVCTAIVLAKNSMLERWENAKYPTIKAGKPSRSRPKNWSAYQQGQEDAEGFDLGVDDRLTAAKGGGK